MRPPEAMNSYNPIEPTVIDEDLLKKASYEQATGDAAEISRKEGIDPPDVTCLRLDYKSEKSFRVKGFGQLTSIRHPQD